jgi:hypothetical protein
MITTIIIITIIVTTTNIMLIIYIYVHVVILFKSPCGTCDLEPLVAVPQKLLEPARPRGLAAHQGRNESIHDRRARGWDVYPIL